MIIYKNTKGYQTLSTCTDQNILTLTQRQNLQESHQFEQEIKYIEKRLAELAEWQEETKEVIQERQMLEFQRMNAQSKVLTDAEKDELMEEIIRLDETVYVVPDGTPLSNKMMEAAPYMDFILDEEGTLVDINPLPKPEPEPEISSPEMASSKPSYLKRFAEYIKK